MDRPHVLWISLEDTSPRFGCYGDETARTPNIDRLAAQGCLFPRAFSVAGVCAPSRSAIITGMDPMSIGTHHMRARTSGRSTSGRWRRRRWCTAGGRRESSRRRRPSAPCRLPLHCPTQGASIAFSTAEDADLRWRLYVEPLRLPRGTTRVRAKAVRIGYLDSGEAAASFTVG